MKPSAIRDKYRPQNPEKYDDRWHNYYPDFMVITRDGRIILVEIKPHYHKRYKVNKAKWAAAEEYCKKHGYEFKGMTEKELF